MPPQKPVYLSMDPQAGTPVEAEYLSTDPDAGTPAPPAPSTGSTPTPSYGQMLRETYEQQSQAGLGALKGVGSTLVGFYNLGAQALPYITPGFPKEAVPPPLEKPAWLTPGGPAQEQGYRVEQLLEFLTPLGWEGAAGKAAVGAPRLVRAGAKMFGAGAEAGMKTAVQGGDSEDVILGSLLGSLGPGVANVVKKTGKAFTQTLPESLYQRIFPTAVQDFQQAWTQQAKGAVPDPTVAQQLLDRGLFGSLRSMGLYAAKKLNTLEATLQQRIGQLSFSLPQKADYIQLLDDIQQQFGKGVFSRSAAEASRLRHLLQATPGATITGNAALATKRFLDGLRTSSAFRANQVLSARQEELKGAADLLRNVLHSAKDVGGLLNDEQLFVRAFEHLADQAAKQGKRQLIGLFDVLAGGFGGFGAGLPGMAIGAGAQRVARSPFTLTAVAQALYRAGQAVPREAADLAGRLLPATVSPGARR